MTNFDIFTQPFYSDKPQKQNFKQKIKLQNDIYNIKPLI